MSQHVTRRDSAHLPTRPAAGRKILAHNLKKWRTARKLTQERLAELTGLNLTFLSLVENARRNISLDNICLIAAALEIPPCRLLENENEDG